MTTVPTLAEMRHALGETSSSEETTVPSLAEMMHANELYQTDPDTYLEHYGIKGMKWGVRRSRELLGRLGGKPKEGIQTKDEEGNVVGGIRARTRAGAQKLKDMREGSTLILEDASGASKIMAKQKDGTFKEVYLSADAERVLRTTKKDSSEMSDKEINDAINRSKKIEEYNRIFHPKPEPNAELQARVDSLNLQLKLRDAQRQLNPPKKSLVKKFIGGAGDGYKVFKKADTDLFDGDLSKQMKDLIKDLSSSKAATSSTAGKAASAAATAASTARAASKAKKGAENRFWSGSENLRTPSASSTRVGDARMSSSDQQRVNDYIYNITTMGKGDVNNPYYNPTTPIAPLGPAPTYPEIER